MNKKIKKIFLTSALSTTILTPLFISFSCNNNASSSNNSNSDDNKTNQNKKTKNNVNNHIDRIDKTTNEETNTKNDVVKLLAKGVGVKFTNFGPNGKTNPVRISPTDIKFELVGEHANKFKMVILSVYGEQDENGNDISYRTGRLFIEYKLIYNENNKETIDRQAILDGFATSPFPMNPDGTISFNDNLSQKAQAEYAKKSPEDRFKFENERYMKSLRNARFRENKEQNFRTELKQNENEIAKFNQKAKTLGLDSFENMAVRDFTLPQYDKTGKNLGLNIIDGQPFGVKKSFVDSLGNKSPYQIGGLARTLINDKYRQAALQTYSITFSNKLEKDDEGYVEGRDKYLNTSGTMWILDAQLKDNEKYPTRFFFGTNVHVADALSKKTATVTIKRLSKTVGVNSTLKPTNFDPNIETFIFRMNNNEDRRVFKTIFAAKNYLSTSPSQYLVEGQKQKYKDIEEFSDFAVLEMDLSKLIDQNLTGKIDQYNEVSMHASEDHGGISPLFNAPKNAVELSKRITNDYAVEKDNQIKLLKKSYLNNYETINSPLIKSNIDPSSKKDSVLLVGYPTTVFDWYLSKKPYENAKYLDKEITKYNQSLWTNNYSSHYESSNSQNEEVGSRLSYLMGPRTFNLKPGVVDAFISSPKIGKEFYRSSDGKQYINFGLEYMPRFYAPGGGASGSSMRNQNNELIGAYHLSYQGEGTGLVAALRSEGFKYEGLFGSYDLPQYDLIFGSGKNQTNSFRQTLVAESKDIKTILMPDGVENIPAGYDFTKVGQ